VFVIMSDEERWSIPGNQGAAIRSCLHAALGLASGIRGGVHRAVCRTGASLKGAERIAFQWPILSVLMACRVRPLSYVGSQASLKALRSSSPPPAIRSRAPRLMR
jgi:hypothetical protein